MMLMLRCLIFWSTTAALLLLAQTAGAKEVESQASAPTCNLARGCSYAVTTTWPDPLFTEQQKAYPDSGGRELTDGLKGTATYKDPRWQAFTRQGGRRIQLDLGRDSTIHSIGGHFLQFRDAGVHVPRYVRFYLSADGDEWVPVGQVATQVGPWYPSPRTEDIRLTGLRHIARYVRLEFPVDVLVFLDEVEVEGSEGVQPGAVSLATLQAAELTPETALLGPAAMEKQGYPAPGSPATGGVRHIALAICAYPPNPADGKWVAADYLPYVAYVDEAGQPQDWMFDTIALCPQGTTPTQHSFGLNTPDKATNLADWQWYLNEVFEPGHQLDALEAAVAQAKAALGDPDYKVNVILTLVNASPAQPDFGDPWGHGKSLNFDYRKIGPGLALANRLSAEEWLLSEFLRRWEERDYQHLRLVGFYWHPESIGFRYSPNDDEFVRGVADLVHARGLKLYWIPYYGAEGSYDWHKYGFDVAVLQPNYMFSDTQEERLQVTSQIAQILGMGVELEKHWNSNWTELSKWIDYLNGGVKYSYIDTVVAYYQNYKDFGRAALTDPGTRKLFYEFVYQFIKGTYHPWQLMTP